MRIRSVKPEYWTDQKVNAWDAETRLAFIWCWSAADDWGCLKVSPGALRSGAFEAHDMTMARGKEILDEILSSGRMVTYDVDGETYAYIPAWFKHQKPNNPSAPMYPPPKEDSGASLFMAEYVQRLEYACSLNRSNKPAMKAALQTLSEGCLDTVKTGYLQCQAPVTPGAGEPGSRGAGGSYSTTSGKPADDAVDGKQAIHPLLADYPAATSKRAATLAKKIGADYDDFLESILSMWNDYSVLRAETLGTRKYTPVDAIPRNRINGRNFVDALLLLLELGHDMDYLRQCLLGVQRDEWTTSDGKRMNTWEWAWRDDEKLEKYHDLGGDTKPAEAQKKSMYMDLADRFDNWGKTDA